VQSIFAVTIPFFALVLIGYLAGRWGKLPEVAIPGLNAFVLYFALPCLLFRFGMNTPVLQLLSPGVLGVWVVCALVMVAVTVALTLRAPLGLMDAAFGALVAAWPNTGFIGVPLLVTLLGAAAAGPMISAILLDVIVTSSVCIALAQWREASARGHRAAILNALRGAASNPLPWAIVLGAASGATGLRPTGPLEVIVNMLSDAASPVALFTIGAVMWRAGRHAHARTPPSRFLPIALLKLFAHPVLIAVVGKSAQALGAPLSDFELLVLVLNGSLPSASGVSMLAERYGADNGRIARIILSSTMLSFLTFSALAWALGVGR
jgi:predicted permease